MIYDEAIAFWFGRINYEIRAAAPKDLKLERMRALARLLGNPQERLRIVHVTGTKGKGSTCAMLDAVCRAAGYRVGLFTSPHLVRVEERMQVNGVPISREELTARMQEVVPAVKELEKHPWPPPTFFEINTALGLCHFVCRRVDLVILEVGLGGRYDSTNICRPLVSIITSIGYDHMAQLGNSLEAIAWQKAGIIKPRVPVISGVTQPGPRAIIAEEARQSASPLIQLGQSFCYQPGPESTVTVATGRTWPTLRLGLLGDHQAANAALVVAAVEQLRDQGLVIPDAAVAHGLAEVRWPARIEVIRRRPTIILDSAHNVPSVEALVATLRQGVTARGRKIVIFAVSQDKQYAEMMQLLASYFDEFAFCRYGSNPRAVAPELLSKVLQVASPGKPFSLFEQPGQAWQAVRPGLHQDDLLVVTGSVFLAGELWDFVAQDRSALASEW